MTRTTPENPVYSLIIQYTKVCTISQDGPFDRPKNLPKNIDPELMFEV